MLERVVGWNEKKLKGEREGGENGKAIRKQNLDHQETLHQIKGRPFFSHLANSRTIIGPFIALHLTATIGRINMFIATHTNLLSLL
jgi:hypothetical protein